MKLILAITIAITAAGCASQPAADPTGQPVCDETIGFDVDGTLVVTLDNGTPAPCDLRHGMQLDLVWSEHTEGDGWGGDSSVMSSEQEALDAGCFPEWINDGDFRLVGHDCDF